MQGTTIAFSFFTFKTHHGILIDTRYNQLSHPGITNQSLVVPVSPDFVADEHLNMLRRNYSSLQIRLQRIYS